MCLDRNYKPETMKKHIEKLPKGYIEVYKIIELIDEKYYPVYHSYIVYKDGLNKASLNKINKPGKLILTLKGPKYEPGFHSFSLYKNAKKWGIARRYWSGMRLIKCKIKKEWITAIGEQDGIIYVTDRIVIPNLEDNASLFL